MSIKAVIWDIGGVLIRTEDWSFRHKMAAKLGLPLRHIYDLVFDGEVGQQAQRGEITPPELWEYARRELNLDPDGIAEFREQFFAGDVMDQALIERIRGLKKRYRTGIITNAWIDLRQTLENNWLIGDAFDAIVVSAEEGLMKPDSRIYQKALDMLQVEAAQAVFLDDNAANVEGARRHGLAAIHFSDPDQALIELDQYLAQDG
jgi:epoxide hydrolase-like predicted phosphatase